MNKIENKNLADAHSSHQWGSYYYPDFRDKLERAYLHPKVPDVAREAIWERVEGCAGLDWMEDSYIRYAEIANAVAENMPQRDDSMW